MTITFRGVTAVLLPGTGSDDDYVYRAFAPALHGVGAVPIPQGLRPDLRRAISCCRAAMQ